MTDRSLTDPKAALSQVFTLPGGWLQDSHTMEPLPLVSSSLYTLAPPLGPEGTAIGAEKCRNGWEEWLDAPAPVWVQWPSHLLLPNRNVNSPHLFLLRREFQHSSRHNGLPVDGSEEAQLPAGGWVGRLAEDRPSRDCKHPTSK